MYCLRQRFGFDALPWRKFRIGCAGLLQREAFIVELADVGHEFARPLAIARQCRIGRTAKCNRRLEGFADLIIGPFLKQLQCMDAIEGPGMNTRERKVGLAYFKNVGRLFGFVDADGNNARLVPPPLHAIHRGAFHRHKTP